MLWELWLWRPGETSWRKIGQSISGPDDIIRQSVMRGLLQGPAGQGGQVYAWHSLSGRREMFQLVGSALMKMQIV